MEIMPASCDKGACVQFLYQHWEQECPIRLCYVGDDLTDESAFKAVNELGGMSIHIGKVIESTQATYTLSSVEDLYDALGYLCLK